VSAGIERLDRVAARVARDGAGGDLPGNMVELLRARQEVRVNLKVIRTADDTLGSLFDEWA
jgi:hypothetical protein